MKQSDLNLCPQCKHPMHLPIRNEQKDDRPEYAGSFSFDGGCPYVVWIKVDKDSGLQETHEHCDCNYDDGSLKI
jgi:hypothetical protein